MAWSEARLAKFRATMKETMSRRRAKREAKEEEMKGIIAEAEKRAMKPSVLKARRQKVKCKYCGEKFMRGGIYVHQATCNENPKNKKGAKTNGIIEHSTNGHSKKSIILSSPEVQFEVTAAHTSGTIEQLLRDVAESEKLSFNSLAGRVGARLSTLAGR